MKIVYSLILLLLSSTFYGQNREVILDIIARESCGCITSKNLDFTEGDIEKIQIEFGFCIISSYSNHKNEFDEPINLDFNDEDMLSKLGEEIALKMVSHCPDVIMALGTRENELEEEIANSILEGTFLESKNGDFQTVSFKENNGRIHTMIVLNFFENVDLLTENLIKKNEKVIVEYFEQEFYDPKLNDFRYYKVIQGIKKL